MRTFSTALVVATLFATAAAAQTNPISPDRLAAHVKALADPRLAGRAPGGPGEAGTIDYIVGQFNALGLKPAGDNGGWTQAVPLIRFQVQQADAKFSLTAGGTTKPLTEIKDVMVWTQRRLRRRRQGAWLG
jgi:hypothetical protein